MKNNKLKGFVVAGIAAAVMAGCGDSGDSTTGDGSTGVTTVGSVSGFGSVYVNGVKYETGQTEYTVEDKAALDDSALKVGMVVKVKGSVNPDGVTGTADQITYEDDVEGPVVDLAVDPADATIKTMTIYGIPVSVSSADTQFDTQYDANFSFSTLANGDHIEVSGYFNGQTLQATYIKKEDAADNTYEVKGEISNFNGSDQFDLTTVNGVITPITISASATTPAGGIANGQYVEVEFSTTQASPTDPVINEASKVELEDRHHLNASDGHIEIRGLLSKDATGNLFLNAIPLVISDIARYEPAELETTITDLPLGEDIEVKVEGNYGTDGVLVATEIENEQYSHEFKGKVVTVSPTSAKSGTVTIGFGPSITGTLTVILDGNTVYPQDLSTALFDLRNSNSITDGDGVEVKVMESPTGELYATRLEVGSSTSTEYKLQGQVDAIDANTITVMNITYSYDAGTTFNPPTPLPTVGQRVEILDTIGDDGIADKIEIKD